MEILFQDKFMAVACKEPGVLSQSDGDKVSMETILSQELGGRVSAVHRLDLPVGGAMVFAKSKKSASALSRAVAEHRLEKTYLAVVKGELPQSKGTMTDLLYHDPRSNKTFVVDRQRKGVREAILHYDVLETAEIQGETWSLVSVLLETGRTHQIRIQFGSRQHPLWGDGKYGSKAAQGFGLWCHHLKVPHPTKNQVVEVTSNPPKGMPWDEFTKLG